MELVELDEREQHQEQPDAQKHSTEGVQLCRLRIDHRQVPPDPPRGEEEGDGADRDVHEEDESPAEVGPPNADQHAADDGPEGGADTHHRAEHAERAASLAFRKAVLDVAGDLRSE